MFASQWRMGRDPQALAVRRAVFVEELGLPEESVFDSSDEYAAQLAAELDGIPVATARLLPEGADARLSFVAVLRAYRGQGFGDLCVRHALYKAQGMHVPRVFADVPERYAAYYAAFGFRETGEPEAGVIRMAVETDRILWHPPCKADA
ncbi:MAG TPA: GNAT family N-acetyltransferase [Feifaniaceae bacterium]|nr:GNAT family N-acetyltransferase [Feifaniaceae bacterium]